MFSRKSDICIMSKLIKNKRKDIYSSNEVSFLKN